MKLGEIAVEYLKGETKYTDFIELITKQYNCTKKEAEEAADHVIKVERKALKREMKKWDYGRFRIEQRKHHNGLKKFVVWSLDNVPGIENHVLEEVIPENDREMKEIEESLDRGQGIAARNNR